MRTYSDMKDSNPEKYVKQLSNFSIYSPNWSKTLSINRDNLVFQFDLPNLKTKPDSIYLIKLI